MSEKSDMLSEVFVSDKDSSAAVSRLVKAGAARKLGPRLYTKNKNDPEAAIVNRNLWPIAGLLMPGAVVSHRTALEFKPAPDGSVFLSGDYPRQIQLPGIILRQVVGPEPIEDDLRYMGSLFISSRPRAFLENLLPSRRGGKSAKTIDRKEVEIRLAEILQVEGEESLNRLRDRARAVAKQLGFDDQFRTLDSLVGALLGTRKATLTAPAARAYAAGEPYDPNRLPVFQALFASLRARSWPNLPDKAATAPAFHNAAFFDAYFSNYIEGTDFPVDEALRIVFENEIPADRPADAHDVLATFRLAASMDEMRIRPQDFDAFLSVLKRRHGVVLERRPDKLPGKFKTRNNQAGSTLFVSHELVKGTLRKGFQIYQALDEPFAQALFMMFLVAEVHPFMDGNGRMARLMMNAELIAQGQTRIIIPAVYRNEYVSSLKLLTNLGDPDAFLRVMKFAQEFVSRIDFSGIQEARTALEAHNAFRDPTESVKLTMPE